MRIIAKTQFDLTTLFEYIKHFTGENVVKTTGKPHSVMLGYNPHLDKHGYYTFITGVVTNNYITLIENFDLTVTTLEQVDDRRIILISGSLDQWFIAINRNERIRSVNDIMEKAYLYFRDVEGLGYLWNSFSKVRDPKGNLLLLEKK